MTGRDPDAVRRPLRLRVLIRRFHPIVGGMERQCRALCGRWARAGAEVEVWTRRIAPGSPAVEPLDGFVVRRFRPGGLGRWGEYGGLFPIARRLVVSRRDYDVAVVFGGGWLAVAAGLAATRAGRPWIFRPATAGDVTRFLDPGASPGAGTPRAWLRGHVPPPGRRAAVLRSADAVVAVSDEIAAELARFDFEPDRIISLPNGVDTDRFRPPSDTERRAARERLGLPRDAVVVLFLGRLVARKGVLDLVAAWRTVPGTPDLPPAMLVIAGSGAGQVDSVEAEVRAAAGTAAGMIMAPVTAVPMAAAPIVLPGAVEDPSRWLAACDVFVLPSHAEGLSNALLEAMAAGRAIVASDIPSTRAAVGAAAWLAPTGDAAALGTALAAAIWDPDGRAARGRAARDRAEARFGLDSAAERWLALLHRVARR